MDEDAIATKWPAKQGCQLKPIKLRQMCHPAPIVLISPCGLQTGMGSSLLLSAPNTTVGW